MAHDGAIPFNLSEYEDGQWIGGEFYSSSRLSKRSTMTKEDHLYGVFNEGHATSGRERQRRQKDRNITKPMMFVSGGKQEVDESEPMDEEPPSSSHRGGLGHPQVSERLSSSRSTSVVDSSHGVGSTRGGLGFTQYRHHSQRDDDIVGGGGGGASDGASRGSEMLPRSFTSKASRQELAMDDASLHGLTPSSFGGGGRPRPSTNQQRSQSVPTHAPPQIDESRYGLGAALLRGMGWEGGALKAASGGQGLAKPIEVKLRKRGAGLGSIDERTPSQIIEDNAREEERQRAAMAFGGSTAADSHAHSMPDRMMEPRDAFWKKKGPSPGHLRDNNVNNQWGAKKKKNTKGGKKVKRVYKTAQQVLQESAAENGPEKQLIWDYTQKGQPQLRSTASKNDPSRYQALPVPELQHNLRHLVEMKEVKIHTLERRRQSSAKRLERLEKTVSDMEAKIIQQGSMANACKEISSIVDQCCERVQNDKLPPAKLGSIFAEMRSRYPKEFVYYRVHDVAFAMAVPAVRRIASTWKPLADPEHPALLRTMSQWMVVLSEMGDDGDDPTAKAALNDGGEGNARHRKGGSSTTTTTTTDPATTTTTTRMYDDLVADTVLLRIRQALANEWNPRDSDGAILMLETWRPLMSGDVFEALLDQAVMPRITKAVQSWDPRTDTTPIHHWLHPWLPVLGDRLEPAYHPLRQKLERVLADPSSPWHPSDRSARAILEPWVKVFRVKSMEGLLLRAILPRLEAVLTNELRIDPRAQFLEPFSWVIRWEDIFPPRHFISLMERGFFPKWIAALEVWLRNSPDYEEIRRWYSGWKQQFPQSFLKHERVQAQFNHALQLMKYHISGSKGPPPTLSLPHQYPPGAAAARHGALRSVPSSQASGHPVAPSAPPRAHDYSFKELLDKFASRSGVVFMPKHVRPDGKQVYQFGSHSVVLENNVIYARIGSEWKPVSPDELLANQ